MTARTAVTGLRLLPSPRCDPPYDETVASSVLDRSEGAPGRPVQGTLALAFRLPGDLPAVPDGRPVRVVGSPPAGGGADDDFGRRPTGTGQLPDPGAWSARLAVAVVEVLDGARPIEQLRRWTSDEVYAQLRRQRGVARVREPLTRARTRAAVRVRAVRVCRPADGVAEACAVVDDGRPRAVALRLVGLDGRWRLLAFERI